MGCFDGGGRVAEQDTVLQKEYASIGREQFESYKRRYEPIMNDLFSRAMDPNFASEQSDLAAQGVDEQFDITRGNIDRSMRKYRVDLDDRQQTTMNRMLSFDQSATKDDVKNRTRLGASDLQDDVRSQMISIGTGIRSEALGNYSQGARMEANRGQQNLNLRTQSSQQNLQTAGTAASLAMMYFIMSDKDKKENITDADTGESLKEIRALHLKHYDYRDGIGPSGKRTGVLSQESEGISSDDHLMVHLGDWNAKNTGAIQELDKELRALQQHVLKLKRAA